VIAIDTGPGGDRVAERLQRSLGLEANELVVLSEDDPDTQGAEVLLSGDRDRERLEKVMAPGIRWVHVLSTGVDGFPFDLVEDRVLTCSRGASALAISEFVLATMLAFEKQIPEIWITRVDDWDDVRLGQLSGQTLGLIGIGAIGAATATRALAFGLKVVAYRRTQKPSPVSEVVILSDITELFAMSDHLVIAAPATEVTSRLLDASAFASMKEGVHLVNISRGALVDQNALIEALDSGRVARATLDVTDPEPLPEGHRLYSHPSVRISPHVSWSSSSTMRTTMEMFEENFRLYASGRPLNGVVDTMAGY
jgi:phosphoglycerate dehydrogenase-like enzyme